MKFKIASLFMAVFAVSQFGYADKAHAATSGMSAQKNTPLETTTHGKGCGCSCCGLPSEESAQD